MKTVKAEELIGKIEISDASGAAYKIESRRGFGDFVAFVSDEWPFDDEGNEIEVEWKKTILTKREVEKIFDAKIIGEDGEEEI